MKLPPLQNRAAILLFFLFLWAALVAAHLFYYSVIASELYIERGNALAERVGIIPAKRGKILDKNGIKVAWTEKYIDLYIDEIPELPLHRNKLEREIRKYFINFTLTAKTKDICLLKNLSPIDQVQLYPLIKKFTEIIFKERKERKYISEDFRSSIRNIEQKYDKKLKGKNGVFKVMADRTGKWIPGTWEEKREPVHGKDVILEVGYEQK